MLSQEYKDFILDVPFDEDEIHSAVRRLKNISVVGVVPKACNPRTSNVEVHKSSAHFHCYYRTGNISLCLKLDITILGFKGKCHDPLICNDWDRRP